MDYDQDSFLAGLAFARNVVGWAQTDISSGGGSGSGSGIIDENTQTTFNGVLIGEDGYIISKPLSNIISQGNYNPVTSNAVASALSSIQNRLTFDDYPQAGSSNPVYSNGISVAINSALSSTQSKLTFDNYPREGSSNPVYSGGIYIGTNSAIASALSTMQSRLDFDEYPQLGSFNPVYSNGIYNRLNLKAPLESPIFTGTPSINAELDMVNHRIVNVLSPTFPSDVANKAYVDSNITSVFKPAGSIEFENLPSLSSDILYYLYYVVDSFISTSDFAQGSGIAYPSGTNVSIINVGTENEPIYKYDAMGAIVNFGDYLPRTGGTMTGNLILNADPTNDFQAATKKYVDDNNILFIDARTVSAEEAYTKIRAAYGKAEIIVAYLFETSNYVLMHCIGASIPSSSYGSFQFGSQQDNVNYSINLFGNSNTNYYYWSNVKILTPDTEPMANSINWVTSRGIKTYVDNKSSIIIDYDEYKADPTGAQDIIEKALNNKQAVQLKMFYEDLQNENINQNLYFNLINNYYDSNNNFYPSKYEFNLIKNKKSYFIDLKFAQYQQTPGRFVTAASWDPLEIYDLSLESGGNINGNISMNSNYIVDLAMPINDYDAATKKYVDEQVSTIFLHISMNAEEAFEKAEEAYGKAELIAVAEVDGQDYSTEFYMHFVFREDYTMSDYQKVTYLFCADCRQSTVSVQLIKETITSGGESTTTFSWSEVKNDGIDTTPTENSTNLITSGGVKSYTDNQIILSEITLGSAWTSSEPYSQIATTSVTIPSNAKVDLQPSAQQLISLANDGVTALMISNDSGTLTAYALGSTPSAMTIQCSIERIKT